MATEKEEVILKFEIDQKDALTELERTKKSIIGIKQEQAELQKAYKSGTVTLDEFAQESVRLEAILKRQQSTYNNVQKSVTGVKTQLDKLIQSNEKISKSFSEAADKISIAGVSIGDISTKLASFANPATAAVGITGALAAVYARSTIGAKDLEFAQTQLNTAITIGTNAFAGLVSSVEDGEGIVTTFLNGILFKLSPEVATASRIAALNAEKLEDLQREAIALRDDANERLERNQELLTEIQSEQVKYNDKIAKANDIIKNLRTNQAFLKFNAQEQLKVLQQQLNLDKQNENLQEAVLLKKREISKIDADAEKKVQNIVRLTQNLAEAEGKRVAIANEVSRLNRIRNVSAGGVDSTAQSGVIGASENIQGANQAEQQIRNAQYLNNALAKLDQDRTIYEAKQNQERYENTVKYARASEQAQYESAVMIFSALSQIAKEGSDAQKAFALLSIGADTAEAIAALTAASEQNPLNGPTGGVAGILQYATGIARILANIATAKSFIAAAGGGDFVTKGPTMLMVGDNPGGVERVTVEPISGRGKTQMIGNNFVAMAGGGSLTTNPGGLVTNSLTSDVNSQLMMANYMKNLPNQVIGVEQFNREARRLSTKQNAVKITGRRNVA